MQKGADQQTWSAPSIDSRYSTATSRKFGTPRIRRRVVRRPYGESRVEQRLKHWVLPEFRGRKHQTVTQRPFSPPSFPARRKRRGRRRRVRNDHDGTSRRKRRLLSSVLISSFPNRELNSRFGGDFDFPSDSLEPTRKTASVFLNFSRDS